MKSEEIKKIENWLNGPQDYNEGLEIYKSRPKNLKVTLYAILLKGESKITRMKLQHELKKVLARLEASDKTKVKSEPVEKANDLPGEDPPIKVTKDSPVSEVITAIEFWLQGRKNYNTGIELLKLIPGGYTTSLQLRTGCYEDQIRLSHWLRQGIEVLKNETIETE